MSPITHLLASWTLAESSKLDARDRAIVVWVGLSPDLDGLGIIPDVVAQLLGWTNPELYMQFHHQLLHGLFGAVLLPALAILAAHRRISTFCWCVAAFHLHLACDLVGSRGATPDDIWPIPYLAPFSDALTISWSGQWPLNSWNNVAITIGLLGFMFARTITHNRSVLSLISSRANDLFTQTVKHRWNQLRGRM